MALVKAHVPLWSYMFSESTKWGQQNLSYGNVARIKSEGLYDVCSPSVTMNCVLPFVRQRIRQTLGVQEEKGPLPCPPKQNLVHRERKNGQVTFKGALSTAPGHKEGTQQT